ncbi:MAG: EAL domain-containing protein, partial [Rhodoferax sp.]|nr:EAL domain-containing protein [Rhodoferax sp.]
AFERIVSVNAAFSTITGYTAQEALGQTADLLRSGVHSADFRAQVRAAMLGDGPWQGEIIGKRKNGELFPQSVSISVVRNDAGQVTHAFSIFSDISVLRAAEARMQHLANFDSLTGLPNRTHFHQVVDVALANARRNDGNGAVLALNLRRFHAINDTFGHEFGDELLRQISQRLRHALRDEDVLSRFGGDEFAVALLDVQKREHGGIVAQKLLAALKPGFSIDGTEVHTRASIGISVFPDDGVDVATLLHHADIAVKRLKAEEDSGYLFYSLEMDRRARERWQLEGELRQALADRHLLLHYQPKVSLRSGRIVGAEALIRWSHPTKGLISPGFFIPLAEETGLILEIGDWVLEEACRQISAWRDAGIEVPLVSVNLSARQFDPLLPARMQAVLDRYHLPAANLQLEITESLLMRGAESAIQIMNALVAMGLALSMDDFGTGYSSLAYLKKFPISSLKIDRSFVMGIPVDPNDCAIAQAIVTMAQQLRQEIVAEGIETREQMHFLRALGCDQLQGFLFSPGVSAQVFEKMVQSNQRLALD